jgi:hypothetical protein
MAGIDLDGFLKRCNRLVEAPCAPKPQAKCDMCPGIVAIEADGAPGLR